MDLFGGALEPHQTTMQGEVILRMYGGGATICNFGLRLWLWQGARGCEAVPNTAYIYMSLCMHHAVENRLCSLWFFTVTVADLRVFGKCWGRSC